MAPAIPAAPVEPVAPAIPVAPVEPVAPAIPAAPVEPVAPAIPVAPVDPVAPAIPAAPVEPVAPAIPVAPVEPVAPVLPVTPVSTGTSVTNKVAFTLAAVEYHKLLGIWLTKLIVMGRLLTSRMAKPIICPVLIDDTALILSPCDETIAKERSYAPIEDWAATHQLIRYLPVLPIVITPVAGSLVMSPLLETVVSKRTLDPGVTKPPKWFSTWIDNVSIFNLLTLSHFISSY